MSERKSERKSQPEPGDRKSFLTLVARLLWAALDASVVLAGGVALFAFAARFFWAADMCCQFRVQILIFLVPATLIYWLLRRGRLAWWLLVCMLANAVPLTPCLWPAAVPTAEAGTPVTRFMLLNVLVTNRQYETVVDYVREKSPDVFVVLEADGAWTDGLLPLRQDFSHRYVIDNRGTSSIAIYSRIPFEAAETIWSTSFSMPSVKMEFNLDGRAVQVIATHPFVPLTVETADARNEQMRDVAGQLDQSRARILLGDFNCAPWSPHFGDMLATANVKPVGYGRGLSPTWYRFSRRGDPLQASWLFGLKLDHVLVSPDVQPLSYQIGPNVGSDHRPLTVDFQLTE